MKYLRFGPAAANSPTLVVRDRVWYLVADAVYARTVAFALESVRRGAQEALS